jgi:nucleoside-diphosphate-sugar epimerase
MSGLIFITGATGFIGATTAKKALEKGYKLRISVRKEAQIEKVRATLGHQDQLDFVVISDITDPKAFAGKLDNVDYVLHLASPFLGRGTDKSAFFSPAVNGTTAILTEAAKVPSVKKVVITSSVAAFMPLGGPNAGKVSGMYFPSAPLTSG